MRDYHLFLYRGDTDGHALADTAIRAASNPLLCIEAIAYNMPNLFPMAEIGDYIVINKGSEDYVYRYYYNKETLHYGLQLIKTQERRNGREYYYCPVQRR